MNRPRYVRAALAAFMAAQVIGIMFMLGGSQSLPRPALASLFIWHLFLLPLTIIFVGAASAFGGVLRGAKALFVGKGSTEPAAPSNEMPEPASLSRRDFLTATAVLLPPMFNIGATAFALNQLEHFRINRIDVAIPSLPRALDGLTIAQVSDTHVGSFTTGRTLKAIAEATNRLNADLVLLTGDLINRNITDLPAACEMVNLIDPRSGRFLIEGNHDLFEGRSRFAAGVRGAKLNLLVDESRTLVLRDTPVQLLGLGWGTQRGTTDFRVRESAQKLLAQRDKEAFPILLAHHPHAFDTAAAHDIPLTLSGHTHGGQLHVSKHLGFGPLMYRYWSGLYRKQNSALVVSNGTGNWFPLRINAPAEIVHITLRAV